MRPFHRGQAWLLVAAAFWCAAPRGGCVPMATNYAPGDADTGGDRDASVDAGADADSVDWTPVVATWHRRYETFQEEGHFINACEWQYPVQRADDIIVVADSCEASETTLLRLDRYGTLLESQRLAALERYNNPAAVAGTRDGGILAVLTGGSENNAVVIRLDADLDVVFAVQTPSDRYVHRASLVELPRGDIYVAMPDSAHDHDRLHVVVLHLSAEGELLRAVEINPIGQFLWASIAEHSDGGVTVVSCGIEDGVEACAASALDDDLVLASSGLIQAPTPLRAADVATADGVTYLVGNLEYGLLVAALGADGEVRWARQASVDWGMPVDSDGYSEIDVVAGVATVAAWTGWPQGDGTGDLLLAQFDVEDGELLGAVRTEDFGDWGGLDASGEAVVVATRFNGVARFGPDLELDGCENDRVEDLEVSDAVVEIVELPIEARDIEFELRSINTTTTSLDFDTTTVCEGP